MQGFGGQNIHIIRDTDPRDIHAQLKALGIKGGHFNNGTFTLPKDKFAPAFLATFKRISDILEDNDAPLIVAINSDKSMIDSYEGKENEEDLVAKLVPQQERAQNVTSLLSALYPDRPVVAIFYDEQTPFELYEELYVSGYSMDSLHKVGFGTSLDDKPIIGAEFFDWVYACPLPFDEKPVMHQDTRDATSTDRQPDVVEKLTEVIGPHGKPYITKEGKLLFPVPPTLQKYADPSIGGPAPAPREP
jgi:hypothetical protein